MRCAAEEKSFWKTIGQRNLSHFGSILNVVIKILNINSKLKSGCSQRSYQEGLICTLTEGGVVWAVNWRLTGEL